MPIASYYEPGALVTEKVKQPDLSIQRLERIESCMPNVCFFSFKEYDRGVVVTIKGRAVNPAYTNLNFRVQDLLTRWFTTDPARIRQAITTELQGTSRTIVFVGERTHESYWVPQEVAMTLEAKKPVYAVRLSGTNGRTPKCLSDNGIQVHSWSEAKLQELATR